MSYYDDDYSVMSYLPIEILRHILKFLPLKWLIRCRLVCFTWKQVVDDITCNDNFWKTYCQLDYSNMYDLVREKCRRSMNSYDIYRSLTFWSKLQEAKEEHDEFCSASCFQEEVKSFTLLTNGVLGVHKRSAITYYDIETLKPAARTSIEGGYLRYSENENFLVLLGMYLHLSILRKLPGKVSREPDVVVDSVKTYVLLEEAIYLVNSHDDLYMCDCSKEKLSAELLVHSNEGVMALAHNEKGLHILTLERNIYTLTGKKLVLVVTLGPSSNLLYVLRQYNFLEMLDWRVYFQWMFLMNHSIPQGPLQDIVIIRTYGDIVFVGSNWGVLRIYHQPTALAEFDIFNTMPLKQYNFMERADCPVLSMCPILNIDVYEVHDGHILIVAMPKKIALINYSHNDAGPLSISSLSLCSDPAAVKIITIV